MKNLQAVGRLDITLILSGQKSKVTNAFRISFVTLFSVCRMKVTPQALTMALARERMKIITGQKLLSLKKTKARSTASSRMKWASYGGLKQKQAKERRLDEMLVKHCF